VFRPCRLFFWSPHRVRSGHYMERILIGLGILALLTGCGGSTADRAELAGQELVRTKEAIQEANNAFMAAVRAGNGAQLVRDYYADDAIVLPPNQDAVSGKTQIEALWTGLLKSGVQEISLITDRVEQGADLAYEVGRYSMTIKPPQGETITDRGKYVVAWRRQPDGKWKAKADIFNTSMPSQPPAAPASSQKK
jgi:uncharacterized protein (TIGR02246 family)